MEVDQPEPPHGFVGCPLKFTFRGFLEDPENVEKADILTWGGAANMRMGMGMGMRLRVGIDSCRTFVLDRYSDG